MGQLYNPDGLRRGRSRYGLGGVPVPTPRRAATREEADGDEVREL